MRDDATGLSRYRRKLQRLERRLAFPSTLNVESTNYCNLKCPMCARTTSMSRPLRHMDSTLFETIAAEAGTHGVDTMWLHVFGEPLLHPRIFELIRTARQYPAIRTVALSTNGTVLDGSRTEELLASGIDAVLLAIDATTESTYRTVRNGGTFTRTVANAERFLDEHRRRRSRIRVDVSDGRAVACCYDVSGALEYGRIPATTLEEIWNGPAMAGLRERHWNLDFEGLPLCRSCDSTVNKSAKEERAAGSPAGAESR